MPIRIDCPVVGYENCWVEYRDEPWPFKDRRRMLSSVSDIDTLTIIMGYISAWNMKDVDGKAVALSQDLAALDDLDDTRVIPWLVGSWFQARAKRSELPKAPSANSARS